MDGIILLTAHRCYCIWSLWTSPVHLLCFHSRRLAHKGRLGVWLLLSSRCSTCTHLTWPELTSVAFCPPSCCFRVTSGNLHCFPITNQIRPSSGTFESRSFHQACAVWNEDSRYEIGPFFSSVGVPGWFSGHRFCIGVATSAASWAIPDHLIKPLVDGQVAHTNCTFIIPSALS